MNQQSKHPVLFVGHGSPMNAIEDNEVSRRWRQLGERLARPRSILCISAHWRSRGSAVTVMSEPRTIHDFGGFPPELFAVRYPAPGDPALAQRVAQLLAPSPVSADGAWGLDHGAWSVLVHLYPDADVPVVQLSLDVELDARAHLELARRLAPLRGEGVLILGSGNIVHNLARMNWSPNAPAAPWADRFDRWAADRISAHDLDALASYQDVGEDARLAVPTDEHYLPLLYCMAQAGLDEKIEYPVEGIAASAISMRSVLIGA